MIPYLIHLKRSLLRCCLIGCTWGVGSAWTENIQSRNRPNIVVFLVDDLGVMDSSVPMLTDQQGQPRLEALNARYHTPALETFSRQALRFSHFFAHSVCSPSRSSLLTGQNSARHRCTNWIDPQKNNAGPQGPKNWKWKGLSPSDITLPRVLKQAGYRTALVGKGHLGPIGSEGENPRNLGFDISLASGSMGQPGSYYGEDNYGQATKHSPAKPNAIPDLERYHGTSTFLSEALTKEAVQIIKQAHQDAVPLFLVVSHYAVHTPHQADPRFVARYASMGLTPEELAFATLVEGVDKSFGDLRKTFNDLGLGGQTLMFFLGDNGSDAPVGDPHGWGSSAPLRGKKGTRFEGGHRSILMAGWAELQPNEIQQGSWRFSGNAIRSESAFIEDLYPTILGVCGVNDASQHTVDGRDLREVSKVGKEVGEERLFLEHYPHWHRNIYYSSLTGQRWKLIYNYFPGKFKEESVSAEKQKSEEYRRWKSYAMGRSSPTRYELYDLAKDPSETHNVAEEQPELLRLWMEMLVRRLHDANALYPVDEKGVEQRPIVPK